MPVLIIGSGMIGSHIAKEIKRTEKNVYILGYNPEISYIQHISGVEEDEIFNRFIGGWGDLDIYLEKFNIDTLIIAAGSMMPSFQNSITKSMINESNLVMAISSGVRKYVVKKIIYISSFAVYGGSSLNREDIEPAPRSPYGMVKLYNEQLLKQLSENGREVVILRPAGVIGPTAEKSGNWMSKQFRKIFLEINKDFKVPKFLLTEREYLDVRDLSRFIVTLLNRDIKYDVINIGTGKLIEPNDMLDLLKRFSGNKLEYNGVFKSGAELKRSPLCIEKAKNKYNYTPVFDMKDSLNYLNDFHINYVEKESNYV
ncbi:NAD(P)-dependent oxidoreductase [Bacillus cereus group sp. BfR-BA-01380]|uniref:NAD-dependent epimerase/dehydratase family protein n=1 Tax=Bacillus cereus group sp. BfR-BA-01380 TaxID=2920324 RepID=UPI001F5A6CEA|nr:NAD(P)-dependent oxidoreductase [Bacillus cereus group sp. BfR-BA-01380]